jgi:predicted RNA binding protein YcfA (HicA-like mRNA interferase family)
MPKLPRLSGKQLVRYLGRFGFIEVRQKGSHIILKKKTSEGTTGCVVPDHKELAEGTLRGILKQAKISAEEFLKQIEE